MKTLALIASLLALSAQAADYECNFTIVKDGKALGVMKIGQDVGSSAGRIFTLPLSAKKNLLGRTIETVEVTLDGHLFSGGESDGNTGIDGHFTLVTSSNRRGLGSRSTSVSKVGIASIKGLGHVSPTSTNSMGYSVLGSCDVNE